MEGSAGAAMTSLAPCGGEVPVDDSETFLDLTPVIKELIPIKILRFRERRDLQLNFGSRSCSSLLGTLCVAGIAEHHSLIRTDIQQEATERVDVFDRDRILVVVAAFEGYGNRMPGTDFSF
jgi:hypothetical protein